MKIHHSLIKACVASMFFSTTAYAETPALNLDSEIPADLNVDLPLDLNAELPPDLNLDLPMDLSAELPKDAVGDMAVPTTTNISPYAESSTTKSGMSGKTMNAKVDVLRAELGGFTDSAAPDSDAYLNGAGSLSGKFGGAWEYALGARFDVQAQSGSPDYFRAKLDYTENYLRWRSSEMRFTVGTQNLLWGRVDEIPPVDRLSRADLSRGVLDRLPDRRRAVPAIRLESFQGSFKIDAVWVPVFDPAVMPDEKSAWHPVDVVNQRMLGIGALQTGGLPIKLGAEDDGGSGGGGIRVTQTGGGLDYGFSLQRARQSTPYYRVGFDFAGGFPSGITLTGVHPYSWVFGGELETQIGSATLRLEAAHTRDMPVTDNTFAYRTEPATDVVVGVEMFPGDGETRITLQLAGHKKDADNVLDRTEFYSLNGELERNFAQGRWRGNLRFFNGLNERDVYLNPKLTYLGIDQHEFYLAAHLFSGNAQSLGGYYQDNDMISVGWQAKF